MDPLSSPSASADTIHPVKVSIGIPVFNGGNYIESTLCAVLSQTFKNLEIIISDNASDDNTQEICERYAAKDERIKYFRNKSNLGAAKNYNLTFAKSTGEFFKWLGHDDPLEPEFIEKSVAILESDPGVIACYSRTKVIDGAGKPKPINLFYKASFSPKPKLNSDDPTTRFYHCVVNQYPPNAIFGLIRKSFLEKTQLIGSYISSDLPLLSEMALCGRIYELSEFLMYRRIHSEQPWMKTDNRRFREAWFDPLREKSLTFPQLRLLSEYYGAIGRASDCRRTRVICSAYMVLWFFKYPLLLHPMKMVLKRLLRTGKKSKLAKVAEKVLWKNQET